MESVAVITGGNGGVGLAVARRLLEEDGANGGRRVRVCLACRNMEKAEKARQSLLVEHPEAQVDVLKVDTSSTSSVQAAAKEIRSRYTHVDWLYCNAGIYPVSGVNWWALWPPTPSNLHYNLSTGGDLLRTVDGTTPEGLREVFATNVFGHYLLIHHLRDFLSSQGRPCHIIWTSSSAGDKSKLSVDPSDIQGANSTDPYSYSKKVMDLLSCELNKEMNDQGVYSHTVCPGLVMTQMANGMMPRWVWLVVYPILLLIRLFVTHLMTLDPYSGAESLVWLSKQDPVSLDHSVKYRSRTGFSGRTYIDQIKIAGSEELCSHVYQQIQLLAGRFHKDLNS